MFYEACLRDLKMTITFDEKYLSLHDDMYIALSLLLKMYDFMSDESSLIPYDGRKIDEPINLRKELEAL